MAVLGGCSYFRDVIGTKTLEAAESDYSCDFYSTLENMPVVSFSSVLKAIVSDSKL